MLDECQYCTRRPDTECDNCEAMLCDEHAASESTTPSTVCGCQEACGTEAHTTCGRCTWCQLHGSRKP